MTGAVKVYRIWKEAKKIVKRLRDIGEEHG